MVRWTKLHDTPEGLRYFRDEETGAIAIADRSGNTPSHTEDGVWYLDTARPLEVRNSSVGGLCVDIPLSRNPDFTHPKCPVNYTTDAISSIAFLRDYFHIPPIKQHGVTIALEVV